MMYEALLFDMNALGDIPDKDFTSRTVRTGSSTHGGRGRGRGRPLWGADTLGWTGFHNFWVLSPPGSEVNPRGSIRMCESSETASPGGSLLGRNDITGGSPLE